jgi:hypothetical protein
MKNDIVDENVSNLYEIWNNVRILMRRPQVV